MRKDQELGPGLAIMLLGSVMIGSVYWTSKFALNTEDYYNNFVGGMDRAMEKAYGTVVGAERIQYSR